MTPGPSAEWWRSAVVYQIYPRSFADSNGDGIGDVDGIRARLPYLADLGVDAIWISPWYPSPLLDGGYDVADYRRINPDFGTLADADAMIAEAHDLGLRVLIDLVPNHCSWEHPWFKAAVAAGRGSPERELFWFREGADGPRGTRAAQRLGRVVRRVGVGARRRRPVVPPPVRRQPAGLELGEPGGARGVRLDPALLVRPGHRRLPDRRRRLDVQGRHARRSARAAVPGQPANKYPGHPHWDRDEVHDIHRRWRRIADEYAERPGGAHLRRRSVGDAAGTTRPVPPPGRVALRLQLRCPQGGLGCQGASARSSTIRPERSGTLALRPPGCSATTTRSAIATRYGRDQGEASAAGGVGGLRS